MLSDHEAEFDAFQNIHDAYALDGKTHQEEFNRVGEKITDIIRDYESRLCKHSENTQYGKFSSKLSDKYWEEIRKLFPMIDYIGVKPG